MKKIVEYLEWYSFYNFRSAANWHSCGFHYCKWRTKLWQWTKHRYFWWWWKIENLINYFNEFCWKCFLTSCYNIPCLSSHKMFCDSYILWFFILWVRFFLPFKLNTVKSKNCSKGIIVFHFLFVLHVRSYDEVLPSTSSWLWFRWWVCGRARRWWRDIFVWWGTNSGA